MKVLKHPFIKSTTEKDYIETSFVIWIVESYRKWPSLLNKLSQILDRDKVFYLQLVTDGDLGRATILKNVCLLTNYFKFKIT